MEYNGKQADLFALANILFLMVSQCHPFKFAKTNDTNYRYIAGNRPDLFWKIFTSSGFSFSDDLIDMLTGMWQLNPCARFTLDELFAHPWVNGPTIS